MVLDLGVWNGISVVSVVNVRVSMLEADPQNPARLRVREEDGRRLIVPLETSCAVHPVRLVLRRNPVWNLAEVARCVIYLKRLGHRRPIAVYGEALEVAARPADLAGHGVVNGHVGASEANRFVELCQFLESDFLRVRRCCVDFKLVRWRSILAALNAHAAAAA